MISAPQYLCQLAQVSLEQVDNSCETVVSGCGAGVQLKAQVFSQHLVPGSIVEISRKGSLISCDAVILNGTCLVFESRNSFFYLLLFIFCLFSFIILILP